MPIKFIPKPGSIKHVRGDDGALLVEMRRTPSNILVTGYQYKGKWVIVEQHRFKFLRLAEREYKRIYNEF